MGQASENCGGDWDERLINCPNAKTNCVDYETPPSPPSTWRQGRSIQRK